MGRRAVALGIAALGIAFGVFTLDVARDDPGYWFAGASNVAGAALLVAGWALIASGLAFWLWRSDSRVGPLLVLAGFAWFVPEWTAPEVGSSFAFTAGLCLTAACAPLVGHAVLAYPGGLLGSHLERAVVLASYAGGVVVLGLLPSLVFDPVAQSCFQCPANLIVVADDEPFGSDATRVGVYGGLVWALALTVLACLRLARVATRPVVAAGAAYLALVAATYAAALDRGYLSNAGSLERRLWYAQAAALIALSVAVVWGWVRSRRARSEIARLVVELAQSPPPGGLRDVFARITGDPRLVLAYPLLDSGRLVDAGGRPVEVSPGQVRTSIVRDGRPVAVLGHARGLLDDEQLVDEVSAAARLALEHERLQAEVRARLEELRASRARIVESGDTERRRLERDLHDGAQQRLVGLSLSLRLLRSQEPESTELAAAEDELRLAIAELRELAHGIYPAVLSDEGFAAAVEALGEESRVPIRIGALPEERFAAAVETAAYALVAEAAGAASPALAVSARRSDGLLAVEVEASSIDGLDLVILEDRIGALDGRLAVTTDGPERGVTIRAELPCGS
jgi:signal transduction histidine kinase